ncbi:hypothetical protein [Amycolatopsis jejuensis]|uniref:hypothetical protein n=1 Tax=Amycolatopsis jejuensis TaxID=330084 RepID=UPI0012E07BB8|nr:hypothetical protein [Amycolatopsis jejuensis]
MSLYCTLLIVADDPKTTDWMSGWSAIAGVALASATAVTAFLAWLAMKKTNKLQDDQLEELRWTQRRQHAALFGIWLSGSGLATKALYNNAGSQPVRDVLVKLTSENGNDEVLRLRSLAPTTEPEELDQATKAANDLIALGLRINYGEDYRTPDGFGDWHFRDETIALRCRALSETMEVDVGFRDAAGSSWTRLDSGILVEEYQNWRPTSDEQGIAVWEKLGGTVEVVRQQSTQSAKPEMPGSAQFRALRKWLVGLFKRVNKN